ncbi:MAG: cupin domain-containing protein [Betaproteobacteria bacterium]|nr:cupin domain-containing protein [Betaproteobacteria bacterium]
MQSVNFNDSNPLTDLLKSAVQPDLMPKHRHAFQVFRYSEPELAPGKTKSITRLCTSDVVYGAMQTLVEGGDSALHLHAALDGFWMVIRGGAVFTDEQGRETRLGPLEGIMVPRGVPYAFRKDGPETLMLLQVEALNARAKSNAMKYIGANGAQGNAEAKANTLAKVDLYDALQP